MYKRQTLPSLPEQETVSVDRTVFERYLDTGYFFAAEQTQPVKEITAESEQENMIFRAPYAVGDTVYLDLSLIHILSVSDIVALKQNGVVSCHYVDSIGFRELPNFLKPENYLKNAEMAMEDDYGMIDGIVNNGPKQPTVADLEAQVKAGFSISLTELAAASHREQKKPSVLEKLREKMCIRDSARATGMSMEELAQFLTQLKRGGAPFITPNTKEDTDYVHEEE